MVNETAPVPAENSTRRGRGSGGPLVGDLEARLLRRALEAAVHAGRQLGHQDVIAKAFPALLRVVDRHNRPTALGGPGCMEHLAGGQTVARMHRGERRLVVLLRGPWKEVHYPVRHRRSPERGLLLHPMASRQIGARAPT